MTVKSLSEPMTREQQKRLNAMIGDIIKSKIRWEIGGDLRRMSKESWRRFFAAHVRQQQTAPSIDGDFLIVLSVSTREFDKEEASRCIDLIQAFGDEREVKWRPISIASHN